MQALPHIRLGDLHGVTQVPAMQVSPEAQVRPQRPQLASSVAGSTQALPHIRFGALQGSVQAPCHWQAALQVCVPT